LGLRQRDPYFLKSGEVRTPRPHVPQPLSQNGSDVIKALDAETEAKTETAVFETEADA